MEEVLKTIEVRNFKEEIVEINIGQLKDFENHPFRVSDEDLKELMKSIRQIGISSP